MWLLPEGSQKRTREDRKQPRQTQEQEIWLLSSPGTEFGDTNRRRAEGDRISEFKHAATGFSGTSQNCKFGARLKITQGDERETSDEKRLRPGEYSKMNYATRPI